MSKEVKRYGVCDFFPGITEQANGQYVRKDDYDALLAERDAEWISAETPPAYPDAEITYEVTDYLVTNGCTVGICEFQRGHGFDRPWAAWSEYGSLKPSEITHWKPLPAPPALQGEQPCSQR